MSGSSSWKQLSRRQFLALGAATTAVVLSQACAPQAPAAKPTTAPAAGAPAAPTQAAPAVPTATSAAQVPVVNVGLAAPTAAPTPASVPSAGQPATPGGVKRGGTLTVAKPTPMREFDPFQVGPGHYTWIRAFWNTPVRYDAQLNPQPELAESWEFSPDNLAMTLHLRHGVKFHSGRELNSSDVKATVEFASGDNLASLQAMYKTIKEVATPDPYTAVLKFDKVQPGIFDMLDGLYIIDKETIDQRSKMAVGTGPFKMSRYMPNDSVETEAFPDYWERGKPYIQKFIVRQIPDLSAMAINLESGVVDAAWNVNYPDLVRLRDSGKFAMDLGAPGAFKFSFELNTKRPPLDNKKVRQALAWACDRQRFCETGLYGLVPPTPLLWPEHSWAYFKDLEPLMGFDLNKSKQLLAEAGFPNGFDLEILGSSQNGPGHAALMQIVQSDLTKLGINAVIVDQDPNQVSERLNKADMQSTIHTFGRGNRDPGSVFLGTKSLYSAAEGGWTNIEDPNYDQLRKELASTLDRESRKATCRKIQQLMFDDCFNNPVAYQPRAWLLAPYVKNLAYNMDNTPFVADMWLDK